MSEFGESFSDQEWVRMSTTSDPAQSQSCSKSAMKSASVKIGKFTATELDPTLKLPGDAFPFTGPNGRDLRTLATLAPKEKKSSKKSFLLEGTRPETFPFGDAFSDRKLDLAALKRKLENFTFFQGDGPFCKSLKSNIVASIEGDKFSWRDSSVKFSGSICDASCVYFVATVELRAAIFYRKRHFLYAVEKRVSFFPPAISPSAGASEEVPTSDPGSRCFRRATSVELMKKFESASGAEKFEPISAFWKVLGASDGKVLLAATDFDPDLYMQNRNPTLIAHYSLAEFEPFSPRKTGYLPSLVYRGGFILPGAVVGLASDDRIIHRDEDTLKITKMLDFPELPGAPGPTAQICGAKAETLLSAPSSSEIGFVDDRDYVFKAKADSYELEVLTPDLEFYAAFTLCSIPAVSAAPNFQLGWVPVSGDRELSAIAVVTFKAPGQTSCRQLFYGVSVHG